MKTKMFMVMAVAALALLLPSGARAACAAGQIDLSLNNVGGAGIDICFTISGKTLTFNSISGSPVAGQTFVRFDSIGVDPGSLSLSSTSGTGSQTWAVQSCVGFDGFANNGTGNEGTCIGGSTAAGVGTPTGASWTFSGNITGPVAAHVIFGVNGTTTGCTFFASTNPSANGTTTNNTGGLTGNWVATPEPGTLAMLSFGLLGLAGFARRRLFA